MERSKIKETDGLMDEKRRGEINGRVGMIEERERGRRTEEGN